MFCIINLIFKKNIDHEWRFLSYLNSENRLHNFFDTNLTSELRMIYPNETAPKIIVAGTTFSNHEENSSLENAAKNIKTYLFTYLQKTQNDWILLLTRFATDCLQKYIGVLMSIKGTDTNFLYVNKGRKKIMKQDVCHVAVYYLQLIDYRKIDGNHMTHFIKWHCNILVQGKQIQMYI